MLKHLKARDDFAEMSLGAKGFTLIELLVVVIILGILAGVAIFAINGLDDDANKNSCINEKDTVEVAIAAYTTKNPTGTPTLANIQVSGGGNLAKQPKYWTVTAGVPDRINTTAVPAADCS